MFVVFISCCLGFLCWHLVAVTFCFTTTSQVIGQEDRLSSDLYCVECDVKPCCRHTYTHLCTANHHT